VPKKNLHVSEQTRERGTRRRRAAANEALKDGPRGALSHRSLPVGLLFAAWLLFYFVLFMSRGQRWLTSFNNEGAAGLIPEPVIVKTERRWFLRHGRMLGVMLR